MTASPQNQNPADAPAPQSGPPASPTLPASTAAQDAHLADLVDHYWGAMNHVSNLIRASELKAGFILSFYGILLNVVYRSLDSIGDNTRHDGLLYALAALSFVAAGVSIGFCVRCFTPRIEGRYDPNLFFFGDATTKFGDIKAFAKTFHEVSVDGDRLFAQLGEQVYILSKISALKFRDVQRAIRFLALGLVLLLIAVAWYAWGELRNG